jgi:hypothetical protein
MGGPVISAVSAGSHEGKDALMAVPGKAANVEIGKENNGRSLWLRNPPHRSINSEAVSNCDQITKEIAVSLGIDNRQ